MEAEEVLLFIMKKLKEYKANPKQSAFHEKARQKNLKKMFSIYTSLKKKERAKQKLEERKQNKEVPISKPETSQDFEVDIKIENSSNQSDENLENASYEDVPDSNDLISPHNSRDYSEDDSKITLQIDNTCTKSEHELVTDRNQLDECNNENIEDIVSSETPSTSNDLCIDNQRIIDRYNEESDEYMNESDEEKSIDGFLMQLGERLKKLPYSRRSKLEIEFLARLYEVEDCLGLLDD